MNGIAQAYRCHHQEGFVPDKQLLVSLRYSEPKGCQLLEESITAIYVDDVAMNLRESAEEEKADTIYIYKEEKYYKIGSRAFYDFYNAYSKLYSCQ